MEIFIVSNNFFGFYGKYFFISLEIWFLCIGVSNDFPVSTHFPVSMHFNEFLSFLRIFEFLCINC